MARQSRYGVSRRGEALPVMAVKARVVSLGEAGPSRSGQAWLGQARFGRHGLEWPGRLGVVWQSRPG